MAVQQQQRRPGPGLQILEVHPVHPDPTVGDEGFALVLADRLGDTDLKLIDMNPPGDAS